MPPNVIIVFTIITIFTALPLSFLEWHLRRTTSPCACQNDWLPGLHSRYLCDFADHGNNAISRQVGEWA